MFTEIQLQAVGKYFDKADPGTAKAHNPFNGKNATGEHAEAGTDADVVYSKHIHDLPRQKAHLQRPKIQITILLHEDGNIFVETGVINTSPGQPQREYGRFHFQRIMVSQRKNRFAQRRTIPARKPSHHAQIQPDDLAASYPDITRMGIRMKIAVLHNLFDIILSQTMPQVIHIEPLRLQGCNIVEANAVNIFHH